MKRIAFWLAVWSVSVASAIAYWGISWSVVIGSLVILAWVIPRKNRNLQKD